MNKWVFVIILTCLNVSGCATKHEKGAGTHSRPMYISELTFEGNREDVNIARSEIERIVEYYGLKKISGNQSIDSLLDDNDIYMDFYNNEEPSDYTLHVTGLKNEIVLTFRSIDEDFGKSKDNSAFHMLLADLISRLENIFDKPPDIGKNDKLWKMLRE